MAQASFVALLVCLSAWSLVQAEDPTIYMEWDVSYGTISPLGTPQQGILINGQFPGPKINCTSNNNLVINIFNNLDEPLLFTFNGIQQRKNSWKDGTPGTMCPIQPGTNYTYRVQVKDQIGTFYYFPTTGLLKADGGIGALTIHSRQHIPIPYTLPAGEFTVLTGDWYNKGHRELQKSLDSGVNLDRPDGIHINGRSAKVGDQLEPVYTMEAGKTYLYRFCNVGMKTSVNIRIQGHTLELVEIEGSHTVQNIYDAIDLHVGQCLSVLVTANQAPKDYYLVVSSRFLEAPIESVALIRYANGIGPASPQLPPPPPEGTDGITWSLTQFRSFRWNLSASAARPNVQGSYKYGQIPITRTIRLASAKTMIDGELRYAINGVSHIYPDTPFKLAEYYGIANKIFTYDVIGDVPPADPKVAIKAPIVLNATWKSFVEIIFENTEDTIQTWTLDGYAFFAVAIEPGTWSPEKRKSYNLEEAVSRYTIQVYPNSWAAILTALDNPGMWNLRSEMWERTYLGQQLYISVLSHTHSERDEYSLPDDQVLCGGVAGLPKPIPYNPEH